MAKSENQKLKLLYLLKILKEESDESHPIPTKRLIERLQYYDILAERKSIYDDLQQLQNFGYDIEVNKSKTQGGYYLASREFELPELKLLVDAVQSSKFITLKKSNELIRKLESYVSKQEAGQLQRQVFVSNRIKTENEKIYYNVDDIHKAIQDNRQISFQYFEWNTDKKIQMKRNGESYVVSPWALIWRDENYYLVAFEEQNQMIKHFRVDKMQNMNVLMEARTGLSHFKEYNIAEYANRTFGMFGGEEETVSLEFANYLVGVVMDRFGRDISIRKRGGEHFSIRVKVAVSGQFFGWLAGIGKDAKITGPEDVKERYLGYLQEIIDKNTDRKEG